MGLCRRGHGEFPGRQCKVCKAAWTKANDPDRGRRINEKRAAERARAYLFGRIAPGTKPVSLTHEVERRTAGDRACPKCGGPTIWGACASCTPQLVEVPVVLVLIEDLPDTHYAGRLARRRKVRRAGRVVETVAIPEVLRYVSGGFEWLVSESRVTRRKLGTGHAEIVPRSEWESLKEGVSEC